MYVVPTVGRDMWHRDLYTLLRPPERDTELTAYGPVRLRLITTCACRSTSPVPMCGCYELAPVTRIVCSYTSSQATRCAVV